MFSGSNRFILIQDRPVFPSCLFFGRKRAVMSYAYAVGWHSLRFESWLNLPIFHHEIPIHLSLPIQWALMLLQISEILERGFTQVIFFLYKLSASRGCRSNSHDGELQALICNSIAPFGRVLAWRLVRPSLESTLGFHCQTSFQAYVYFLIRKYQAEIMFSLL